MTGKLIFNPVNLAQHETTSPLFTIIFFRIKDAGKVINLPSEYS